MNYFHLSYWSATWRGVRGRQREIFRAVMFIQFVAVQLLLINAIYYFKNTCTALGQMQFRSELFTQLQDSLHFMSGLPVPLPQAFIQGFDWVQHNAEYGCCKPESTYKGVVLFNYALFNQTFWYYYIGTALFKMPLLISGVVLFFITSRFTKGNLVDQLKKYVFIWLPFLYFLIVLSLFNKFQIGIRHAILILPFFYIGISGVFIKMYEKRKWLFAVLSVFHIISIARYWPNIMAYTNELVWNKTRAYKIIADSSIDYGQTNLQLNEFFKTHPDYLLPTNTPMPGKFAITIGRFVNRFPDSPVYDYSWLRNNFEPVDNVNYTILLFSVSEDDLKNKGFR